MKLEAPEPWSWSRRRWGWTLTMLLVLQLGFIWFLSDRSLLPPKRPPHITDFHLVLDPNSDRQLADLLITKDPTLFAMAHTHNISGTTWLNLPTPEHQLLDWTDQGHWAQQEVDTLGADFSASLHAKASPRVMMAEKPAPQLLELLIPNGPITTQSVVLVRGPLAKYPLLSATNLPVWPFPEVITDSPFRSVVQVAVNAEGETLAAQLLENCGVPAVDRYAIQWAKNARYQSSSGLSTNLFQINPPVFWGKLIFEWAAAGTNSARTNN